MTIVIAFLLLSSLYAKASNDTAPSPRLPNAVESQALGVDIENDSRNVGGPGVDQAYSNGIKFSYVYARDHVPFWTPDWFTKLNYVHDQIANSNAKANFGLSVSHQIFTPNNTQIPALIPNDRPYAAWLATTFTMNIKTSERLQNFGLSFGVIGPWAQGEAVQNGFHRMIGATTLLGWQNQLHNEVAIQASYQQRLRFFEVRNGRGSYFDLIPIFGGGIGNVFIGLHSGLIARLGINLPDDLGPSRLSASESDSFVAPSLPPEDLKPSYYVFSSIRGNAVGRNLFLDGNSIEPSPHVTKYPFTMETELGFGVQFMPVSVVWRFIVRSPEFEENSGFNSFASIGFTYFMN